MLGLFPHMKYQPWYALSELVDNALQSAIGNRDALLANDPAFELVVKIEISGVDGGRVTVADNAAGIGAADWERAFQVGEPPEDATGLSQFGVGMKAACCWFARGWSVRTSALGEPAVRKVEFDVPQILRTRDETLQVELAPGDAASHFTVIEMHGLYRPVAGRTLGKIRDYLGDIYRHFIRSGDLKILVNGQAVAFEEPALLTAPRYNEPAGEVVTWRRDVDITLNSGRRVFGFVGIRSVGSARQAGLALFYRNKVVMGAGDEMYKPAALYGGGNTFASQRLFGELHMDAFEVTYSKDALVWYDEEEEFIERLRSLIDAEPLPLVRQANGYRKRTPEVGPGDVANEVLDSIRDAFASTEFDLQSPLSEGENPADEVDLSHSGEPDADSPGEEESGDTARSQPVSRRLDVTFHGVSWQVDLQLVSDEAVDGWLVVRRDGSLLELSVNQAHPFMRAWCEVPGQELEPVWRVAIALGLAQEMARLGGAKLPGLVTTNVNGLLRTVLAHKN